MGLFEALAARNSIENLKENGGVGYTEPGKVYTFDGNTSGKVTFGISGCVYVKISNDTPDLNGIAKGRGFLSGVEFEFDKSGLSIETFESGQSAIHPEIVAPLIWSVVKADATIPEPGLYLLSIGIDYVSRVEFAETIVPIDQKFLPNGTIRLNDYTDRYGTTLSAVVMNLAMYGGGVVTYDSGYEKLWEDILQKQPTHIVLYTGADVRVGVNILCCGENIGTYDWMISGTGVVSLAGMTLEVTCLLKTTEDGKGVTVSVLAEPITFPGTEGE